jgi:glycerol-3-phosphate acyltransferase PlsY
MLPTVAAITGAVVIAYLLGSVSFGYLAGKLLKGIDLRHYGSGNLGASNAFRILGRWPGIAVLVLDTLKGYLAVHIAYGAGEALGIADQSLIMLGVLAGLSAILGHIFTLYHGFKGGKGIATSLGVFLHLTPIPIAFAFGVWLMVFLLTRYISLGSIVAAVTLPLVLLAQRYFFSQDVPGILVALTTVASVIVVAKHTSNIQRLLAGKEHRFEWK